MPTTCSKFDISFMDTLVAICLQVCNNFPPFTCVKIFIATHILWVDFELSDDGIVDKAP